MRFTALLVLVLSWGYQSSARTLFVSDIDDTIKISHVLDTLDAALNATLVENHFTGMSPAFLAYQANDQDAKFIYLSNAPKSLMEQSHNFFLRYNFFPDGSLLLRPNMDDDNFKVATLRRLIRKYQPTRLVLIGDNGEMDVVTYEQIRKEFPQVPTAVFIHQIYSVRGEETGMALREGQKGFVTSVDLMGLFREAGWVTDEQMKKFWSEIIPPILKQEMDEDDGEIAFPVWLDCRDYKVRSPREDSTALFKKYLKLLKDRCSRSPDDD